MTTYLGKSCLFGLPRVPLVNCRQFMYLVISLLVPEDHYWDLIVSVPDHCLSFYSGDLVGFTTCPYTLDFTLIFAYFSKNKRLFLHSSVVGGEIDL